MFFRNLLLWAVGGPITLFMFTWVLLALLVDRSGRLVHSISVLWCRLVLRLSGVRVRVDGLDGFPRDRSVVILSNHQGAFDIPVLQSFIPVQFRWVAKESLFRIPIVGWTMRFAGYVSIDRNNAASAYRSLEEAAAKAGAGASVLIFPEGTRSRTDELLPFKKGAFTLAAKSGLDVVPVAVTGTRDIMKRGGLLIRPADVVLRIGRPIRTAGMEEAALRDSSRREMERLLGTRNR